MGHEELYRRCYVGTKCIVEDYIHTICEALRFVLRYEGKPDQKEEQREEEQERKEGEEGTRKEREERTECECKEEEDEMRSSGNGHETLLETELRKMRELDRRHQYARNRSSSGNLLPRHLHLHYRLDDGSSEITPMQKYYFFKETRHSLGRSALLLSGGITLVSVVVVVVVCCLLFVVVVVVVVCCCCCCCCCCYCGSGGGGGVDGIDLCMLGE